MDPAKTQMAGGLRLRHFISRAGLPNTSRQVTFRQTFRDPQAGMPTSIRGHRNLSLTFNCRNT